MQCSKFSALVVGDPLVHLCTKSYNLVAHSLDARVVFQYVLKYGNEMLTRAILVDMTSSMNAYDDCALISGGGVDSRSALEWMQRDYEGYMRAIVYQQILQNSCEISSEDCFIPCQHAQFSSGNARYAVPFS